MKFKIEKSHKIQKLFILLYLLPICYIILDSIAEVFDFDIVIFSIFSRKIEILVLCSIYGLFYVFFNRKKNIIVSNTVFIAILLSIYMTVRGLFSLTGSDSILAFLSCVILWCLTFFITNNVSINEKEKQIISYIVGFTGLSVALMYLYALQSMFLLDVGAINSIYFVLCSFPFIFFIKNKYVKISLLFIISTTILFSGKSTCIISLILILIYSLFNFKLAFSFKRKIGFSVFSLLLAFLLLYFWFGSLTSIFEIFFISDILYGDLQTGNGRYDIYQKIIVIYSESNFIDQVFGHGYSFVSKVLSISAHNDFLQILFDYGLFGFVLYMLFVVSLINNRKKFEKKSLEYFAYNTSILIFLIVSLASNFINTQVQMMFFVLFWGLFNNNKLNENCFNNR